MKAHAYQDSPEFHDIALNELALDHLLNPSDEDYQLSVGIAYDGENRLAMEYLTDIRNHSEKYKNLDATITVSDIKPFVEESEGLAGFQAYHPSER